MKKIISMLLVITLCFFVLPLSAFAQNSVNEYTNDEKEIILMKYKNNEKMLDTLFGSDAGVAYWNMINRAEKNDFLKWVIGEASKMIGEYPDEQECAEILANLVMMQSGDIAEQVQNQSQYDDLKTGVDYAMDIIDIASDIIGQAKFSQIVSPIIDTATGGAKVLIENVEQAKYYETCIRDYTQAKLFLEAVSNNATDETLKKVASSLLPACNKLLESRLKYLTDSSATLVDYEAKFFVKNMSFALLKTSDLYKTDKTVKRYVDCGEKLGNTISSLLTSAKIAFKVTMLAGDIGFGTTDTFNCYQEMKIVSDVAGAIVKANNKIRVSQGTDSVLSNIQTKCNYYKMLLSTHARGEYLMYKLLLNEAGNINWFKKPKENIESWYAKQIDYITNYYHILEKMFEVSDTTFMTDFGEQCDSKNSSDSYTWIVDPTIEADDIYYLTDYPDPNQAINTVSEQANNPNAVIQRGEQLGIISLEGKLLADLEYKKIANFGDSYMMVRTIPKYSEEFDRDWEIYWLNQEGKVSADVGNGSFDSALYYYFKGVRQQTGYFSGRYIQEVMPVQESSICNPHDIKLVMDNLLGKYALEQNGNLITDFIYDECGSESDGLFAVCQNGKWGYIDKKGQVIIPIEYDASWSQYPVFDFGSSRSSDNVKEYCYAASDGYVVLRQDNQWELKDIIGNSIIPKGVFEAIRPVYEGKCWVKKNGKWGVIQIGNSKGTQKTEDTSIFASMPSEGRFSSGVGGWANNMKLRSDGAFTGVYYDFDLGLTGEGYPRGTAAICNFNGKFSMPEKIDDYTYRTKLKELMKDGVVGEEYIEDGTKYIYSDAFGLEGGENDFIIYTPGKPISELPEGFLSWVRMGSPVADAISNDTLSLYGIYNESLETAFLFYVGRTFNQSDLPADAVEFNGHYY